MKAEYQNELTPEIREKLKKNLVYVSIFSIIMLFAGLISGYIVSMGDNFWLKIPLPNAFYVSTALIGISSLCFILAVQSAKKNKNGALKFFISLAFLSGIGFTYFQFKGYNALLNNGIHFTGSNILVNEGRYGDYFTLKYKGNHLIVDGNTYFLAGKKASDKDKKEIGERAKQLVNADAKNGLNTVSDYGTDFILYYKNQPISFLNNTFLFPDGKVLQNHDLYRLKFFAIHVADGRGDFFVRGEMGKDFKVYFKNTELNYKNRSLFKGNQPLNPYLQNSALDAADTSSSYLYLITFAHLLHIIITLLFLIKTVTFSFSGKYTSEDNLGLRVTGIFWHFLGLLWLFLLLFLLFIH